MDVGYILSNFPPIIENIFKYLSKRELDCCAKVCDLWKRIAETEKNRREDIAFFFQVLTDKDNEVMAPYFMQEYFPEVTGNMESGLSKQLDVLKIKPKFCLAFASSFLVNDFEQFFPSFHYPSSSQAKRLKQDLVRKRAYIKAVIHTALEQYLPKNCPITFCVARGIIGCNKELCPLEIEEGYGICGIMIPFVPGLHIFNFPIDEKQSDISKLIPEDMNIKCLLMFVTPHETSCFNKIIESCLLKQNSKLALGGALIERSELKSGSVVAFCGQSIEAATVIIKPKDKEEELEKKLMLFMETGLLKDRCFAFMFSCVARGYFVYKKYNVESTIFHKLYPEIPLIGIFGNGEIGFDYLPNVPCRNTNQILRIGNLAKCRKRYLHSYTTIFVLVSLKL